MIKKTNRTPNDTSFHGSIVRCTQQELEILFGPPQCESNDGRDKTNFDWTLEDEIGTLCTVYDWKYYRPLEPDELVNWHIGGFNKSDTDRMANAISELVRTTFPTLFSRTETN
jgi:hypothetical protein